MTTLSNPTSRPRRTLRRMLEHVQRLQPARFVGPPRESMPASTAVICVYRKGNAGNVQRLIEGLPDVATVCLWALDEPDESLEPMTVGSGPGGRIALLNKLVDALPAEPEMLVVADDDVQWVVGDLERLVHAGGALGLDIFQPAHSRQSHTAFTFVRKNPWLFARETTFVEQGPVVILSRRAQRSLLPLPDDFVMGWGVEVRWHRIAAETGLRMGIIDAVAIRHDGDAPRRQHTYDTEPELATLRRELAAIGKTYLSEIQTTVREVGWFVSWARPPAVRWHPHRRSAL